MCVELWLWCAFIWAERASILAEVASCKAIMRALPDWVQAALEQDEEVISLIAGDRWVGWRVLGVIDNVLCCVVRGGEIERREEI
jgi:hypothetical protein